MFRLIASAAGLTILAATVACSDSMTTAPARATSSLTPRLSGSGSGGSGSGGGGGSVVPPPPPACSLVALTPKSGYTPQGFSYAAVWVNVTLKNCGTTPITVNADISHDRTGTPIGANGQYPLPTWTGQPGESIAYTVDWDFDDYSTSYTSTVNVRDANTGEVLATCTAISITPKPRSGGSLGGGGNGSSDTACYK